jgi:predicted nucleic acid-binding protein
MELHYGMLRVKGKKYADKIFDELNKFCVDVGNEVIKSANALKAKHNKSNLSYVDCIGYVIAKSRNVRFLTGDKEFSEMENVEFVK